MRRVVFGLTVTEAGIVLAILFFVAGAIVVAIDPAGKGRQTRDAVRFADATRLADGVLRKQIVDRAVWTGSPFAPIIPGGGAQVIVVDAAGVDCATVAARPGCGVALNLTSKTSCVAQFATIPVRVGELALVPGYVPELPVDPRGEGSPPVCGVGSRCATEGALALGGQNTGYYVRRGTGNQLEIGACAGEALTVPGAVSVRR